MPKQSREQREQYAELPIKVDTTPAVDGIGRLDFPGNIIPHAWYQTIRLQSGKPDVVAIILLSDVVYWYKPTYRRDEQSGQIVAVTKKFAKDKLQKNYTQWSEAFGFSKEQVKEAVDRLVEAGLITREFRNITYGQGIVASNVMFVEPVLSAIEQANTIPPKTTPISPPINAPQVGGETDQTYTDTTTDNSAKIGTITPSKSDGELSHRCENVMYTPKEIVGMKPESRISREDSEREMLGQARKGMHAAVVDAISHVTGRKRGEANDPQLRKAAKLLLHDHPGVDASDVYKYFGQGSWYYDNDWRGKNGQAPEIMLIPQLWGKWDMKAVQSKPRSSKPSKIDNIRAGLELAHRMEEHGKQGTDRADPGIVTGLLPPTGSEQRGNGDSPSDVE